MEVRHETPAHRARWPLLIAAPALAAEPRVCGTVRFSDVGWTDITATTAATGAVLRALGYETDGRASCRCR